MEGKQGQGDQGEFSFEAWRKKNREKSPYFVPSPGDKLRQNSSTLPGAPSIEGAKKEDTAD